MLTHEAPTLPCTACGVPLRVDPEARSACCRHCATVTAVPENIREQARVHRLAVEADLRRLGFAEMFARGMDSGAVDRLSRVYGVVIAVLAGILTLGLMAPGFGADEQVGVIAVIIFAAGLPLTMGLFFLGLRWAIRKDALAPDAEPPPVKVTADLAAAAARGPCSACGAPVPFRLGDPVARCPYCGATVLPTEAIRAKLAGFASFRADLEQARNTRSFARADADSKIGRGFNWAMRRMVFFFPLIIGITIGQGLLRTSPPPPGPVPARQVRRPPPPDDTLPTIGAAIMIGGVALTVLLLAGSALLGRGGKRSPRFLALDALARVYGARARADGTRATLEWLDTHWASAAPEGSLVVHNSDDGQSVERVAVALTHRGVPVLVVLAEAPHVRRFDAFVAAYDPARVEHAAGPAAAELQAAGLHVTLGRGGVHLAFPGSDGRFCLPGTAAWMLDRATHLLAGPAGSSPAWGNPG
ncbi:MAG: hypothetical protein ABI193_06120 [Minicystis sp.]